MALEKVTTPTQALNQANGVIRLSELLEETDLNELPARQKVDQLVIQEKAKIFPVGNHLMVKKLS